ncbi:hypothetical protein BST28_17470 [Mycolicibacter kumamotonensis]|uniref:Uncharacterized protein n=1 Tax=Mycolicibacter kumamotonensis TaxID=354243 RepID=A0A1X0DZ81_9MYCO|nr:hypothetical protein [Mycolicibacter kumamotonensis]ORA77592.1 hypothetical protein BST28_17470 [Mycolicibacter kumamotonensis]
MTYDNPAEYTPAQSGVRATWEKLTASSTYTALDAAEAVDPYLTPAEEQRVVRAALDRLWSDKDLTLPAHDGEPALTAEPVAWDVTITDERLVHTATFAAVAEGEDTVPELWTFEWGWTRNTAA